jgi:hypothetical protein
MTPSAADSPFVSLEGGSFENEAGAIMRHIHLDDGIRLRFPSRSEDFDQGVEIGMLAALMDLKTPDFTRLISRANVDQIRSLADKFGYRILEGDGDDGWVEIAFTYGAIRPKLRLVHTAG